VDGAICNGGEKFERRAIQWCPVEKRRRRFYGYFQHWYGWSWHCLGCGDRWSGDGELGPRPFMRGWRKDAIARAKAGWDGVTVGHRESRRAFLTFVHSYFDEVA
jgi:hypothetical protein